MTEFDAGLLLKSLRDHAEHLEGKKKLTMRVTDLVLPSPVATIRRSGQKRSSRFATNSMSVSRSSPRC